jgi:hypothetical protein
MKALLMYPDRDFDPEQPLPVNADDLVQDLALKPLFEAMAQEDKFLFAIAQTALLSSLTDVEPIVYRQHILADCLNNVAVVGELYALAVEAIDREKKTFHFGLKRASIVLRRSVEVLALFVEMLKRLRAIADRAAGDFRATGFVRFFAMLQQELDEGYFASVERHLAELRFRHGVLTSAELGPGNKGVALVLRALPDNRRGRLTRLLSRQPVSYTFHIAPRDEAGARALSELRDRALAPAADAAGRSAEHILSFFKMLRAELAFYIGCLNLHRTLKAKGEPVCFPEPAPAAERRHGCRGLYDVCLSLSMGAPVVGNDLAADGTDLVFITGANQGGKSTFLRSVGVAQLMMQAGLFVPAASFAANLCSGLFTHYKRGEDATMASGKFEEELKRMSAIVDHIGPDALVLCNESFAATNEREGSAIAGQIIDALLAKRIQVFFVTHFYELASAFYDRNRLGALFLRADRTADGRRTFKLIEGEPLATGYGRDLYERIFAGDSAA